MDAQALINEEMNMKAQIKTQSVVYGIIGVLLVGGLGAYLLTPEQLANARTCTSNNVTGIFEKFSSTNVTAYWTENGVQKSALCSKGKWIPTNTWLELNGLTAKDITINPIESSNITEDNIEIITIGQAIIVDQPKQVMIGGNKYNLTYVDKPAKIKCICDKITGCQVKECVQ